ERIGKKVGAGLLSKYFHDFFPGCSESSRSSSQGFPKCTGNDVNPIHYTSVFMRSTTIGTHKPCGMAIIDHHHCLIFLCKITNMVKLGNGSIHREYAIRSDQSASFP